MCIATGKDQEKRSLHSNLHCFRAETSSLSAPGSHLSLSFLFRIGSSSFASRPIRCACFWCRLSARSATRVFCPSTVAPLLQCSSLPAGCPAPSGRSRPRRPSDPPRYFLKGPTPTTTSIDTSPPLRRLVAFFRNRTIVSCADCVA